MATPAFAAGAYAATGAISAPLKATAPAAAAPGTGFSDILGGILRQTAETGRAADKQAIAAAQGKADMVDVVTAVAESETAIQTLVAVRDRVIAAYEDIMRMPI